LASDLKGARGIAGLGPECFPQSADNHEPDRADYEGINEPGNPGEAIGDDVFDLVPEPMNRTAVFRRKVDVDDCGTCQPTIEQRAPAMLGLDATIDSWTSRATTL
jgi:hypothetical protein